ncbi:DUF4255 domain-containing protein [Psychroserpens sp.]|uniref:DUF4255 domain-containing protein n=1 Tax=Psychroserpens sp. TaxID=2020870 RepID=UPI002B2687E5|nr:DUF4255 domain-containing protein [Psychroserpens sp.]
MIEKAIQFTKQAFEQYLKNKMSLHESFVAVNSVIQPDGSLTKSTKNKVILSLINIVRETSKPFSYRNKRLDTGYSNTVPPEKYNLDVLVSSNFDDYSESLKFLNEAILFFQINASISSETNSNIPTGIEKLEFELETISYHQMHSLWNAMGAKYQPSVIYKMRLLTLDPNQTRGFIPEIIETSNMIGQ